MPDSPWLVVRKPAARPRLRLFCLPYAGGNAGAFETWRTGLSSGVELCALQYPGRRERLAEQPLRRMTQLVQALESVLAPHLEPAYAVYGDCLGAYVGYELVRRLCLRGHRAPARLVVSSAVAPHVAEPQPDYAAMDDASFVAEVAALGTLPAAAAAHPELMATALPSARADFELGRSYRFRGQDRLAVPITVVVGDEDPYLSADGVAAWAELTTEPVQVVTVPGGHDLLARAEPRLRAEVQAAVGAAAAQPGTGPAPETAAAPGAPQPAVRR
ncbi:MAG TPA: thioesterase domain-containing protein [Jatrophihabitans sp.]|nr:thioesterase domain-containing protein [Jatrophihabitans sp.]